MAWFEFAKNLHTGGNDIYLYGEIGWDVSGDDFSREIGKLTGDITIYIGSSGGSIIDGFRIYNEMKRHKGLVTTIIDTHAASIASIISLGGSVRKMEPGGFVMIHNPSNLTRGDATEMRRSADLLDKMKSSLLDIYEATTSMKRDDISAAMDNETVFNAKESLEFGFIHEIIEHEEPASQDSSFVGIGANESNFYEYMRCKYDPKYPSATRIRDKDMNFFEKLIDSLNNLLKTVKDPEEKTSLTDLLAMVDKAKTDKDSSNEAEFKASMAAIDAGLAAMTNRLEAQGKVNATPQNVVPLPLDTPQNFDVKAAVDQALNQAREIDIARRTEITKVFNAYPQYANIMNQCVADQLVNVDMARQRILDELAKGQSPTGGSFYGGTTCDEKFMEGVSNSLLARVNVEKRDPANNFNAISLLDAARNCLIRNNVDVRGMDKYTLIRNAFSHSTSDFPLLMSGIVNKILLQAYMAREFSWRKWCGIGSVADFKQYEQIQLGSFNNLDLIPEGGEYTAGTFGEERETYRIATKGKMIGFTRQSMINDDLDGLTRITQMMGHAAARTINRDVYQLLAANPIMANGNPIFNLTDNTLAVAAGPPSIATFQAARQAMRLQKDLNGNDFLDIQPRYVLAPIVLQDSISELLINTTDASQANSQVRNPIQGMVELITDPYMDDSSQTAWYFVSENSVAPLMQVSFLDGNQTPFLDSKEGFESDGIAWKVRMDYGVSPLERRGGFKNNG